MKNLRYVATLAIFAVNLNACSTMNNTGYTMRDGPAEDTPPPAIKTSAAAPIDQSTYHYMVDIYPGLDEKFDPDPKLCVQEYNELVQLDWYCARKTDELKGAAKEMFKQGLTVGGLEGILGAIGYRLGFGSFIKPGDYFTAIGLTAMGGGIANGQTTFDMALNVAHGYCMTGMVYKADELERKLKRIFIVPVYTGSAKLPQVSDRPAPNYTKHTGEFVVPPPH